MWAREGWSRCARCVYLDVPPKLNIFMLYYFMLVVEGKCGCLLQTAQRTAAVGGAADR